MKKYQIITLSLVFVLSSSVLFAQSVSIQTAKKIAKSHLKSIYQATLKSASPDEKKNQFPLINAAVSNKDTLYYILNDTINRSFVIVAADNRVWPILGYSTSSNFNPNNLPPALTDWMESRKLEIAYIKKNNLKADSLTNSKWNDLLSGVTAEDTTSVRPLTQTWWHQVHPYNGLCPPSPAIPKDSIYNGRAAAGCLPIAVAQLMKYWNFPKKGNDNHSYPNSTFGTQSVDFGATTYAWEQMTNKPNTSGSFSKEAQKLIYHCGVAFETDFGLAGSNSEYFSKDRWIKYFNYSTEATKYEREFYKGTDTEWENLLKSELNSYRPIWYSSTGTSGGNPSAHVYICDGYKNSNYFHFNWGWGLDPKDTQWYFYLKSLTPGKSIFNDNHRMIIKLFPKGLPLANAGIDLTVNSLAQVTLDGTQSTDPEKGTLSYQWVAPAGIKLNDAKSSKPSFFAPFVLNDTILTFSLRVDNTIANSTPDLVKVLVKKLAMSTKSLTDASVRIYPNPTSGLISIDGIPADKKSTVALYAIDGKLILEKKNVSGAQKLDLSKQTSGSYILVVNGQSILIQKE
ncbi:MAG: thiol protease/hemagglutinin PrtT [Prolixibacteraceae bacterium]|nr:thiol protease/hemagglutinin PrtT [Prolixibacteraceae bacterium]